MLYDFKGLCDVFEKVSPDAPREMANVVKKYPRVFLYGAGRSGLMMKALTMRLAQSGRTVYVIGETVTPAICEDDLLILASASGTTASVVNYAKVAKDNGAAVYSITASESSPLTALSDGFVCLPSPNKDSEQTNSIMGTLFEQSLLLFCDLVVSEMGDDISKMRARHANLE